MDAAEAAEIVWNCGGAPRNDATSRMEHRLSLTLLNLQREIELLTKAQPDGEDLGGILPVASPSPPLLPPPHDRSFFEPDGGLVLGAMGFRRLRSQFATPDECALLRSAMTLGMVGAFRRGGQVTLSVVPALVERLHAATGDDRAYVALHGLLERIRAAAAADDGRERSLRREQRPTCPVCGKDPRPSERIVPADDLGGCTAPCNAASALSASTSMAASSSSSSTSSSSPSSSTTASSSSSSPPPPPSALYHRGALLVRLLPPESADRLAPACFSLPAEQPYWDPHVDKHNADQYDVSAVLYLSTQVTSTPPSTLKLNPNPGRTLPIHSSTPTSPLHFLHPPFSPHLFPCCLSSTQGIEFDGGDFNFHDESGDQAVQPVRGSLLTFSSGGENPHSAGRVSAGARFALACWFTRDPANAVPLPPLPNAAGDTSSSAAAAGDTALASSSTSTCSTTSSPPPLPLWASDRAIASAAECCLASNDPLREALLLAQASGRPLARATREETGKALVAEPASWLSTLIKTGGAREEEGTAAAAEAGARRKRPAAEAEGAADPGTADGACPSASMCMSSYIYSSEGRISALRAAVSARESALEQARRVRANAAAAAGSSDFDCFG